MCHYRVLPPPPLPPPHSRARSHALFLSVSPFPRERELRLLKEHDMVACGPRALSLCPAFPLTASTLVRVRAGHTHQQTQTRPALRLVVLKKKLKGMTRKVWLSRPSLWTPETATLPGTVLSLRSRFLLVGGCAKRERKRERINECSQGSHCLGTVPSPGSRFVLVSGCAKRERERKDESESAVKAVIVFDPREGDTTGYPSLPTTYTLNPKP